MDCTPCMIGCISDWTAQLTDTSGGREQDLGTGLEHPGHPVACWDLHNEGAIWVPTILGWEVTSLREREIVRRFVSLGNLHVQIFCDLNVDHRSKGLFLAF